MSTITECGKIAKFGSGTCQVLDDGNLVGVGIKLGDLFYLNCEKALPTTVVHMLQMSGKNNQLRDADHEQTTHYL